MMTGENLIYALLGLPVLAALGVLALHRLPNMRDGFAFVISLITAYCAVQIYSDSVNATAYGFAIIPNLSVHFAAEPLGLLFTLIAGVLYPIATLYTIGYLRGAGEANHTRFMFFYALSISAAMGIALAGNLLTLFIFYETLTLVTYPLVIHNGTDEAHKAGRVYLGILLTGSLLFLLPALVAVWAITGTLEFAAGGILAGHMPPAYVPLLLALFAFGTGKAALMPLHRWLPAAMVAPTPVSALLHAVAVVKAGVFTIAKIIIYIFGTKFLTDVGGSEWLVWVAAFSLLAASFVALRKTNLKARLAYSTISQLAYIITGMAMASPLAVAGATHHIATHAVGKITLFFCAGAIYIAHRFTDIKEMDGLGRRMPFTYAAFTIAALSIIGVPPLAGMWSKFLLMAGAIESQHLWVVAVLIVSSLLNLIYLGEIVLRGLFLPAPTQQTSIKEAPLACVIPLLITAALTIALFFYADLFIPNIGS
ncbi:MAG: monovalent cation/H+ antiporter subunit D family protein [Alphaproteobacteria bacterium]|nr:monovalent cation/H+ antiporter subunit D family protein [Alphaproteobacteria bacterium]